MIRKRAKRFASKIQGFRIPGLKLIGFKFIRFIRENKKEMLIAAVTAAVVWFLLELILNFSDFADGFSAGLEQPFG